MKEMEYSASMKCEVLDSGYCFGLLYYIINLGFYPTAYVRIPRNHKFYRKSYDEIDIDVHGGLTYSNDFLWISEKWKVDGWFIGWDYAHCDDYMGYREFYPQSLRLGGKKWTTEEIRKEVRMACYQIRLGEE